MILSITYKELENQILCLYGTTIVLSFIDEKTICVSRKIVSLLPSAKLKIQVINIVDSDVTFSYDGGVLAKSIINGVILFIREKFVRQVSFVERNHVILHLAKIKNIGKIFDLLELRDIVFQENKINLYLEFK